MKKINFVKRLLKSRSGEADAIGVIIGAIGVIFVTIVGAYLLINVAHVLFP